MDNIRDSLKRMVLSVLLVALLPPLASAQENAKGKATQEAPAQPAANPPAQRPQLAMPDAEKMVLLLRTSLLTLNDAIQTGNYTVLRDVAAPSFREGNSAARLSEIFSQLAQQKTDLAGVAILMPQITDPPTLDQGNGLLHIRGFFPGQGIRLDFEVLYQAVAGRWRLFGLSVQPTTVMPVAAAQPTPPQAPPARKAGDAAAKKVEPLKK